MGKDAKRKQVGLRLDFETYEKLRQYGEKDFRAVSKVAEIIIIKFFEQEGNNG
jgi:hypothetical protein